MTTYAHDLAISAVPYDSMLVAELSTCLAPRLRTPPVWAGNVIHDSEDAATTMLGDSSRLVLVLHQRLWRHDGMTQSDDAALRQRLRRRPGSVRVVTLDDEPVPDWLARVPRCDFAAAGLDGVAEFAIDAITASGGSPRRPSHAPASGAPADAPRHWPEGPPAFLTQTRAFSALRRELDALGAELRSRLPLDVPRGSDRTIELHTLPHRLVLRLDGVGISFSWVGGRQGTVSDGRLLVIQWEGAVSRARGIAAMQAATPVRERVYRPEGAGPDSWCWRCDEPNGRASSTANLAAEWLAGASIAPPE